MTVELGYELLRHPTSRGLALTLIGGRVFQPAKRRGQECPRSNDRIRAYATLRRLSTESLPMT